VFVSASLRTNLVCIIISSSALFLLTVRQQLAKESMLPTRMMFLSERQDQLGHRLVSKLSVI
jgi:hypothetical protein